MCRPTVGCARPMARPAADSDPDSSTCKKLRYHSQWGSDITDPFIYAWTPEDSRQFSFCGVLRTLAWSPQDPHHAIHCTFRRRRRHRPEPGRRAQTTGDRKSTRLNSSHSQISYAVFCLKKKRMLV